MRRVIRTLMCCLAAVAVAGTLGAGASSTAMGGSPDGTGLPGCCVH